MQGFLVPNNTDIKSRRGVENEARDLAIYMVRVIRGERLTSIGREFNLNNYSSVSTAHDRIKKNGEQKVQKTLCADIKIIAKVSQPKI